jgi:hypothetical protein
MALKGTSPDWAWAMSAFRATGGAGGVACTVTDGSGGGGGATVCVDGDAAAGVVAMGAATMGADEEPPRDIELDAAWMSGALGPAVVDAGAGAVGTDASGGATAAVVVTEGVGGGTATG